MSRRETWSPKPLHLTWAVAVVVLVAGATGSYVGLSSASTRSPSTDAHTGRPHVARTSADASTPGPGATGSARSGAIACPLIPAATGADGGSGGVGEDTHVFTRTTASGVTIRVYRLPASGACGCGPLVAPPADPSSSPSTSAGVALAPEGAVSVELSDDAAVGQGTLFDTSGPQATTANASTARLAIVTGAFGVTEGEPAWWVAASVGPDVADAEMTFADGSSDQMVPVDGLVVLAHPIDLSTASSGQGAFVVRGTIRLFDATGALLTAASLPASTPSPVPLPIAVPEPAPTAQSGAADATSAAPPSPASGTTGATAVCENDVAPVPPSKAVASPSS